MVLCLHYIELWIETELAAQLVITKYTQYYRIKEDLSNYDLIISSVPIL
ncbi:hypothetical protein [Faecalibacillus intestinalis]